MKRIGLLSDTHGFIHPRLFAFFENVDEIWHSGDFGNIEIADRLADFRPLKGVYGNIDGQDVRVVYPLHERFKCEDVNVWMTHIGGYPGRYEKYVMPEIFRHPPDLFISGHSHILKVMFDKKLNFLHMNPGAAGLKGFHKVLTALRFVVDGKNMRDLEIWEMEKPKKLVHEL
ncbi:metallophosphoesterase family protein [Maribellus maritimus]|uniref:metallophosphoesterase family protein n=1 Tax=Maribellus maritimus TaxID=2870838 RepID=UPI001EEC96B4|nr:metallophosphoesterase family protein [Maribellus maritimus]MCG6186751.1 metallophosphatase family protein [Maribellus maritimus]